MSVEIWLIVPSRTESRRMQDVAASLRPKLLPHAKEAQEACFHVMNYGARIGYLEAARVNLIRYHGQADADTLAAAFEGAQRESNDDDGSTPSGMDGTTH